MPLPEEGTKAALRERPAEVAHLDASGRWIVAQTAERSVLAKLLQVGA